MKQNQSVSYDVSLWVSLMLQEQLHWLTVKVCLVQCALAVKRCVFWMWKAGSKGLDILWWAAVPTDCVCAVCSTKATVLNRLGPGDWSACLRSRCTACLLQGHKKYQDHPQRLHLAIHNSEEQSKSVRIAQAGVLLNIQILLPPKNVRTPRLGLNEIVQVSPWLFSKSELVLTVGKGKPSTCVLLLLLAFLGEAPVGCAYGFLGCLQQIIDAVRCPLPGLWRVLSFGVFFFNLGSSGFFKISFSILSLLFGGESTLGAFSLVLRGEQQQWPYAGI